MRRFRGLRRRFGHSLAADKTRWDKLHAQYKTAYDAALDFRLGLERRYGASGSSSMWRSWITAGERNKLEKLEARRDKIGDKIFDLVTKVSPRDWSTGAPAFWVRSELTWEDAIRPVGEPLSVVVPAPWGARAGLT